MRAEEAGTEPDMDLCSVPNHLKITGADMRGHIWERQLRPLTYHSGHGSSSDFMHDLNSHLDEVNGGKITL